MFQSLECFLRKNQILRQKFLFLLISTYFFIYSSGRPLLHGVHPQPMRHFGRPLPGDYTAVGVLLSLLTAPDARCDLRGLAQRRVRLPPADAPSGERALEPRLHRVPKFLVSCPNPQSIK